MVVANLSQGPVGTVLTREDSSSGLPMLLGRLQVGSRWLAEHHQLLLEEDPLGASGDRLLQVFDGWDRLERLVRVVFGAGQTCPEAAPVRCAACQHQPGAGAGLLT